MALALLAALAVACASFGGARPRFGPANGAVLRQLERPAGDVIGYLDSLLSRLGIPARVVAPREGYLESEWVDVETRRRAPPPYRNLARFVKLRFFADPVAGKTRLMAECVMRVAWDPSLPERDLERMVPEGHPGRAMLQEILRALPDSATAAPARPPIEPRRQP